MVAERELEGFGRPAGMRVVLKVRLSRAPGAVGEVAGVEGGRAGVDRWYSKKGFSANWGAGAALAASASPPRSAKPCSGGLRRRTSPATSLSFAPGYDAPLWLTIVTHAPTSAAVS